MDAGAGEGPCGGACGACECGRGGACEGVCGSDCDGICDGYPAGGRVPRSGGGGGGLEVPGRCGGGGGFAEFMIRVSSWEAAQELRARAWFDSPCFASRSLEPKGSSGGIKRVRTPFQSRFTNAPAPPRRRSQPPGRPRNPREGAAETRRHRDFWGRSTRPADVARGFARIERRSSRSLTPKSLRLCVSAAPPLSGRPGGFPAGGADRLLRGRVRGRRGRAGAAVIDARIAAVRAAAVGRSLAALVLLRARSRRLVRAHEARAAIGRGPAKAVAALFAARARSAIRAARVERPESAHVAGDHLLGRQVERGVARVDLARVGVDGCDPELLGDGVADHALPVPPVVRIAGGHVAVAAPRHEDHPVVPAGGDRVQRRLEVELRVVVLLVQNRRALPGLRAERGMRRQVAHRARPAVRSVAVHRAEQARAGRPAAGRGHRRVEELGERAARREAAAVVAVRIDLRPRGRRVKRVLEDERLAVGREARPRRVRVRGLVIVELAKVRERSGVGRAVGAAIRGAVEVHDRDALASRRRARVLAGLRRPDAEGEVRSVR